MSWVLLQENASCLCVMFFFCLISHKCFDSPGGSQNCAVIFKMLYAKALTFLILIRSKMRLRNQSFHGIQVWLSFFSILGQLFDAAFNQPQIREGRIYKRIGYFKRFLRWSTIRRVSVVCAFLFPLVSAACLISLSVKCYSLFSSLYWKLCSFCSWETKTQYSLINLKKWEH